jgi:manganese transport protein
MFCRDPKLVGNLVNSRLTNWAAHAVAAMIIGLNVFLLYQTFVPTA